MEFISRLRWVIITLVLLFVLVFVGWGLSSIARSIFKGPSSSTSTTPDDISIEDIETVKFTTDGPVVAGENHRSYTIQVSKAEVTMKVYANYGQKVLSMKSYPNTSLAYENFIASLRRNNALARASGTDTDDDYNEKGACSSGRRYILELGDSVRRWSTSCQAKQGTAAGSMSAIRTLFSKQVPDFRELTLGTNLTPN